jgi:hypothetical protein
MFTPLNAELIHLGRSLFHRGFAETSAADLTGVTQILYYYILSVNVRVGPWLIFDLSAEISDCVLQECQSPVLTSWFIYQKISKAGIALGYHRLGG